MRGWAERAAVAALLAVCAWSCGALAYVFGRAVPFPFELEWGESASLCMAHRLASGQPLYAAPSLEHVAVPYPPLYYALGAVLARWLGWGLPTFRLLSLAAFVATAAGMAWLVRRETANRTAAVVAVGCYAAFFELSGAWYHLARVDSLFVCLLWWGLATLCCARSQRTVLLAAGLFSLAFLVKQTLLLVLPFLLVIVVVARRRWWVAFVAVLGGLLGLSVLAGDRLSNGWFRFYVFEFQVQRGFHLELATAFLRQAGLPLALVAAAGALAWMRGARQTPQVALRQWPWLLATAGCLAVGLAAIAQPGGAFNNAMPLFACLGTLAGLGFGFFPAGTRTIEWRSMYCLLLAGACAAAGYDPGRYVPRPADLAAGRRVVEVLAALPDPVWIPHTPSYYFLTGHRPFAHQAALWDIGRSDATEAKRVVVEALLAAIARRAFSGVVLGREEGLVHAALRQAGYRPVFLHAEPDGLWTKTGFRWRPEVLFLRDAHAARTPPASPR